jgi:hypothetical protein
VLRAAVPISMRTSVPCPEERLQPGILQSPQPVAAMSRRLRFDLRLIH